MGEVSSRKSQFNSGPQCVLGNYLTLDFTLGVSRVMARKSNGLEKYALGMSNQVHGPSVLRSAAKKIARTCACAELSLGRLAASTAF